MPTHLQRQKYRLHVFKVNECTTSRPWEAKTEQSPQKYHLSQINLVKSKENNSEATSLKYVICLIAIYA